MKTKIFVYGTLKKGFGLNGHLKTSKFLGNAELRKYVLYILPFGIPYIVKGGGIVKGEVYEIDKHTLDILDVIEGAYTRTKEKVMLGDKEVEINVYTFDEVLRESKIVVSGVFKYD